MYCYLIVWNRIQLSNRRTRALFDTVAQSSYNKLKIAKDSPIVVTKDSPISIPELEIPPVIKTKDSIEVLNMPQQEYTGSDVPSDIVLIESSEEECFPKLPVDDNSSTKSGSSTSSNSNSPTIKKPRGGIGSLMQLGRLNSSMNGRKMIKSPSQNHLETMESSSQDMKGSDGSKEGTKSKDNASLNHSASSTKKPHHRQSISQDSGSVLSSVSRPKTIRDKKITKPTSESSPTISPTKNTDSIEIIPKSLPLKSAFKHPESIKKRKKIRFALSSKYLQLHALSGKQLSAYSLEASTPEPDPLEYRLTRHFGLEKKIIGQNVGLFILFLLANLPLFGLIVWEMWYGEEVGWELSWGCGFWRCACDFMNPIVIFYFNGPLRRKCVDWIVKSRVYGFFNPFKSVF